MKKSKFEFANGNALRVLNNIENETPRLVNKVICDILDIKDTSQATVVICIQNSYFDLLDTITDSTNKIRRLL